MEFDTEKIVYMYKFIVFFIEQVHGGITNVNEKTTFVCGQI